MHITIDQKKPHQQLIKPYAIQHYNTAFCTDIYKLTLIGGNQSDGFFL